MKSLPVFVAFLAVYGNFAAPIDDVMQEKLKTLLLPPLSDGFEGEGVRDRNEGNMKVESERMEVNKEVKGDEVRSRGDVKFDGSDIGINFYEFKTLENGNYHFEYHQSDLQRREEFGVFDHDPATNDRVLSVSGSYEYIRPDGKRQLVEYTAGKEGFNPKVTVE